MPRPTLLLLSTSVALLLAHAHAADPAEVRIRDYRFVPERVTIRAGQTVRWTNDEKRASHSMRFPAEGVESERLLNGDSWERRFDKPGLHPYTCEPHPQMQGIVEVLP